jgi:PAS domain S-box-containing protein
MTEPFPLSTSAGAGRARHLPRGEERKRTSAFVLLRFTLLIATSYLLLAAEGFAGLPVVVIVWIGVGLLSNVVATRLSRRLLESAGFAAGALLVDTLWITAGLLMTGRFEPEFFYLYFFVLFLAAIGESLGLIALGSLVVCTAYLFTLSASGGGSLAGVLTDSASLVRIPFLFAVACFYGYLVDRLRKERRRAGTEAATVDRLQEIRGTLETANRRLEREVRERRRAEEQVRKLSRAVEQSPSMVIITDLDGVIEYANPRFAAVTGFGPQEILGRNLKSIGVPEDGLSDHAEIAEVLAAGTGWRGELRYHRPGGEVLWAATSISPLRNQQGQQTHFIVVQEDVTERRLAEESLKQANHELARLSELKSAFVSTVSHELRTPLTSIQNALDIVRGGKAGPLAPDQRRFLDMARRNQQRLAGIIDDLLDLSKLEAGGLDYHFREVEPAGLLAEVREAFEPQAEAARVRLAVETAAAPAPPVLADPVRVTQILTNLVGNALKFTPPGGRVSLSARVSGDWLELSVADTGSGILPDDQRRVFEPFFQGSDQDPLTRTARGTGLGLAISRELARAHGGEVVVASVPGEGSRFTLRLPADLARASETVAFEEEVRLHRKYPFFGTLVIDWPAGEAEAGSPLADPEGRRSALLALRDRLREALPRDCDLIRVQPAHGRIVLVLLATPRDGSEVVKRRLEQRLAETGIRIEGRVLPPPRVLGPAVYPDDGETGRALIEVCLAASLPGEAAGDAAAGERPGEPGGTVHELPEDRGGGRRAGRGGEPAVPAHAGGLRGGNGHRWPGGSGGRPLEPAGPGAPRRDDAAGERLPRVAHAARG